MLWVKGIIAMAAHTHLAEHGSHINKHTTRPSTWHEFVTPKTRMISQISQAFRTIFQEGKAYFPFPTIKFISTSQPSPITFIYFLHWVHLRQVFVVWRQWHRSWKLEKTNTATFLVASIQWDFLVANVVLDISGKYSLSIVGIYSLLITCRPTWASCLLSSCCFLKRWQMSHRSLTYQRSRSWRHRYVKRDDEEVKQRKQRWTHSQSLDHSLRFFWSCFLICCQKATRFILSRSKGTK